VKNHLSTPLTVVPVLTLGSGESIKLSPLTIAPFATKSLSLKSQPPLSTLGKTGAGRWGDGSRSNSFIGNARLIPVDPVGSTPNDFSAWILVKSPTERLGVVSMFEKPINALSTVRQGLWWLPYPDAQAYYAVQNTSSTSLDVEMQLYADSKLAKQRSLKLGPFAFQLIDVAKELGLPKAPKLGGVRFAYKGSRHGQVTCKGLLVQERHGFSVSYMLHESLSGYFPHKAVSELQSPAAYFGKLAKLSGRSNTYVHPHLLLRNASTRRIVVNATVYGRDVSGHYTQWRLKPVTLESQSIKHVDLEAQRQKAQSTLADGVAGLRLTYKGGSTDLVADMFNVDTTGDFVLYDDVRNMSSYHSSGQVAISFDLSGTNQTYIIVKNVTDKVQQPDVFLYYDDGAGLYWVRLPEIPAQQVEIVDIRHLRDAHVPDLQGQELPANAEFGGALVLSESGAVVASDPTFDYSTATLPGDLRGPEGPDDQDRPRSPHSCMDPENVTDRWRYVCRYVTGMAAADVCSFHCEGHCRTRPQPDYCTTTHDNINDCHYTSANSCTLCQWYHNGRPEGAEAFFP
jgi:hypothetical protein